MTRKTNYETAEKESRMQAALEAIKKFGKKDITKIANLYNVSSSTLRKRVKGRRSRQECRAEQQALTPAEEHELERWITKLTITGFAPRHEVVRQMANSIRNRRTRRNPDLEYQKNELGQDWVRNYIQRHPNLKTVVGKTIEASRIENNTAEILQKWFDAFQSEVIDDPAVLLENVYNMDESGFSIGVIKAGRVIVNAKIGQKYQAQPGRQEWVTLSNI